MCRAKVSPAEVSASFGLHRTWAYKVQAAAWGRGRGWRALRSSRGTGRPRTLSGAQERQVFRWINGKNPRQYGFEFALRTRALVCSLLEREFGVRLSLASVCTLLARLGLSAQKPLQRTCQRDPVAIARWQSETYPQIARQAKREGADIYFGDESELRADGVPGKTWTAKGHTPVVGVPGQRQGISDASALSAKGAFWFATYKGGLNAALFITLLKRLMRKRRKPLHLIVDNLPAHKSAAVRDYVDSLHSKLTLHFLPGYAPELNPNELAWSYSKRTDRAQQPLRAGEKLENKVHDQLSDMAQGPALIQSFFKHPSVGYISDC